MYCTISRRMRFPFTTRSCRSLLLAFVLAYSSTSRGEVIFEFVTVNNPGNPSDPTTGHGYVGYPYRIAKFEVTNDQYIEFLNHVDPNGNNPHGVFHPYMDLYGGIRFDFGAPAGAKYTPWAHMGNKPVIAVSFLQAMRFANWLHNGQGSGDTECGAYEIGNGISEQRAAAARFFIPNDNEWYKAAFYDPTPGAGGGDNYWLYATRSNDSPTGAIATSIGDIANPGSNVVNYRNGALWYPAPAHSSRYTTVGSAGVLSESYYGTRDQNGNAFEWNETSVLTAGRALRGGYFEDFEYPLQSGYRLFIPPETNGLVTGFRIACPASLECSESPDFDGDGACDNIDDDDDNDGIRDVEDACPHSTIGLAVSCDGRPRLDCSNDCRLDGDDVSCFVTALLGT